MKPQEITTHALALGITPELYPEFWGYHCARCGYEGENAEHCWCSSTRDSNIVDACTLLDPTSDDPRACLWEPFYMRALGWPSICLYTGIVNRVEYKVNDRIGATWQQSPTAALHAAWLAKGAKG